MTTTGETSGSTSTSTTAATATINCSAYFAGIIGAKCNRYGSKEVACAADDEDCLATECVDTTASPVAGGSLQSLCNTQCSGCAQCCNNVDKCREVEDLVCAPNTPLAGEQSSAIGSVSDSDALCDVLCLADDASAPVVSAAARQNSLLFFMSSALTALLLFQYQ